MMGKSIVSLPGSILWVLLAASMVFAQSGQVLKGNVQQNASPPSDQQVQTIVLDMYHQLSIMWGNASASQGAQKAYQADVAKFDGYVSAGSALAAKLSPCVSKYQQAYPHIVLQSQYYNQNNSTAFNSQAAIADPLLKAGAGCVNSTTGDQFADGGQTVYNTYQGTPTPPPGPAPVYQGQTRAWTPRCATPTSTNCYLWLLNRNGLYSHIYQGGPPNCTQSGPGYVPGQNRECEGNGGPDQPVDEQPAPAYKQDPKSKYFQLGDTGTGINTGATNNGASGGTSSNQYSYPAPKALKPPRFKHGSATVYWYGPQGIEHEIMNVRIQDDSSLTTSVRITNAGLVATLRGTLNSSRTAFTPTSVVYKNGGAEYRVMNGSAISIRY